MNELLTWISSNQGIASAVISAVVAAAVAFIVFALTQFFTSKREQIRFLTPKLEELYLHLNAVASDNASLFKLAINCVEGKSTACNQLGSIDEITLYGHGRAKEIIMLVRLYFPQLSRIHQHLFSAQHELNNQLWKLLNGDPPERAKVIFSSGFVSHFIRLMEAEIINNRSALVGDYVFFKRFRRTTDKEMSAFQPPPEGPIFSSPNKATNNAPSAPDAAEPRRL